VHDDYSPGKHRISDIEDNFELPAGTAAMAFGDNGQMRADFGGDVAEEFWHDAFQ